MVAKELMNGFADLDGATEALRQATRTALDLLDELESFFDKQPKMQGRQLAQAFFQLARRARERVRSVP